MPYFKIPASGTLPMLTCTDPGTYACEMQGQSPLLTQMLKQVSKGMGQGANPGPHLTNVQPRPGYCWASCL